MSVHDPKATLNQIQDDVDYQVLWEAVKNDLPLLLATVAKMLAES